jgi:hypothetical protein
VQAPRNADGWRPPLHEALAAPGQSFGLCSRDVGDPGGPWYESHYAVCVQVPNMFVGQLHGRSLIAWWLQCAFVEQQPECMLLQWHQSPVQCISCFLRCVTVAVICRVYQQGLCGCRQHSAAAAAAAAEPSQHDAVPHAAALAAAVEAGPTPIAATQPFLLPAEPRQTGEVALKANLDAITATADGHLGSAYAAAGLKAGAVPRLPSLESIVPCTAGRIVTSSMTAVAMPQAQQPAAPHNSPSVDGSIRSGGAAVRVSTARAAAAGAHLQRMLQAGHYTKPDAIVR